MKINLYKEMDERIADILAIKNDPTSRQTGRCVYLPNKEQSLMKYIAYILSMPNKGSWDGKWTGEKNVHARVRKVSDKYFESSATKEKEIVDNSFFYSWDDGWTAQIEVRQVSEKEAKALKKRSVGFCGYDWMIDSLIHNGDIRYEANWRQPFYM